MGKGTQQMNDLGDVNRRGFFLSSCDHPLVQCPSWIEGAGVALILSVMSPLQITPVK